MNYKKIHDHLCLWSVLYVIGLYVIIHGGGWILFDYHFREPGIVLLVLGAVFILLTAIARRLK